MDGSFLDIENLALYDPISALALLKGLKPLPICMNIPVIFTTFTVGGQPLEASLDTTIAQRTWVKDVEFDLQLPNVFAGNIGKAQYIAYLKESPGVSIKLSVQSGPRYIVMNRFTPINNFCGMFKSMWPSGWMLEKLQTIQAEFTLTDPPPSIDPNGPPYNVTLTLNCWQFDDVTIQNVSVEEAKARLKAAGVKIYDVK